MLHRVKGLKIMEIPILRFTRLPFGCAPSPFILNATLIKYLKACINKEENKAVVEEIQDDLFVDDSTSGGINEHETQEIKDTATWVFAEGGFILQKWHSNILSLEKSATRIQGIEETVTYALEQAGNKTYRD